MTALSANSVLPAQRIPLQLHASDGVTLRGELALPDWTAPIATLVCIHPLTTHGGSMESHLFRKMSWRLPALTGLAVLRFNMRGAGTGALRSEGEFAESRLEGLDLGAALTEVMARDLPDPWLVGWSFGTDIAVKFGDRDPVAGAILLSPPLRFCDDTDLRRWASPVVPWWRWCPNTMITCSRLRPSAGSRSSRRRMFVESPKPVICGWANVSSGSC